MGGEMYITIIIMEKLHGGNWLLVDVKGREWELKRGHKGGAHKGPFYMRIIALLDKLESLRAPFHITSPLAMKYSYIIKGSFP